MPNHRDNPEERLNAVLTIRLIEEHMAEVEKLARKHNMSAAKMARVLMIRGLRGVLNGEPLPALH